MLYLIAAILTVITERRKAMERITSFSNTKTFGTGSYLQWSSFFSSFSIMLCFTARKRLFPSRGPWFTLSSGLVVLAHSARIFTLLAEMMMLSYGAQDICSNGCFL